MEKIKCGENEADASHGSKTMTVTGSEESGNGKTVKIKARDSKETPKRRVTWTEATVDNEHMGKKSSKGRNAKYLSDRDLLAIELLNLRNNCEYIQVYCGYKNNVHPQLFKTRNIKSCTSNLCAKIRSSFYLFLSLFDFGEFSLEFVFFCLSFGQCGVESDLQFRVLLLELVHDLLVSFLFSFCAFLNLLLAQFFDLFPSLRELRLFVDGHLSVVDVCLPSVDGIDVHRFG